jgi:hypothetical protein
MSPDIDFMVGGEAGQRVQSICHCEADFVSRSNLMEGYGIATLRWQ